MSERGKALWSIMEDAANHKTRSELMTEIRQLEAKLATANALVTCCCGNPVDSHGYGDGHSPVDQYHYSYTKLTEENERLKAENQLLQDIIDSRPAINAGLPETYIRWSQAIYSGDAVRAAMERDA